MEMASKREEVVTVITITLRRSGEVFVNGPLTDKILCFGMLEMAKGLVANYREERKVLVPQMAIPKIPS